MKKSPSVKWQLLSLALLFGALALLSINASAQIAVGKSKFLGNIFTGNPPSDFSTYWNQVTPENAGKWGSVEPTQGVFNWSPLDVVYNYAQQNGYLFKMHNLVWGSQYPSWLSSLSSTDQRTAIETWFQAVAQRYQNIWAIDVVNEPVKTPYPFKAALGGDGATGYDWVVTSYQLARQYFPNKLLLINEYGTENDPSARSQYLNIINILKSKGLLDGIGVQAHYFNLDYTSADQLTSALNDYAATGLPVYISEFDITGGGTDAGQLAKYQELFPVVWTHPAVKGITLWGYIDGLTWHAGTGIVYSNGTERPAMTWLKSYVASH